LNPPPQMPESFDSGQHAFNTARGACMPEETEDTTPQKFFERPFSPDEDIEWLKTELYEKKSGGSATGDDHIAYDEIRLFDNQDLANLFNDYRLIGLESCLFRCLTLLIHKRIADWSSQNNLIPDYQNGFRPGYRTNNNPFILRCAKDWAKAHRRPLYTAVVDASNAFPWTNRETLWLKLQSMGMGGPLFD
ncbi:hypothetical protein BDZ89DRAFT_906009, partial [Hymenopellis radicata]